MLKRSANLLLIALHQTFFPLRKELLVNGIYMALSVTMAIFIASSLHFPAPYWAGISAMMVVTPTLTGTLRKGAMRIFGTYLGAFAGWLMIVLGVAQYLPLFFVVLFFSIALPLTWTQTARYPYAVLIGGITCNMVMLAGLIDATETLHYAEIRSLEITVGALTSLVLYPVFTLFGKMYCQVDIKERKKKPSHAFAGSRLRTGLAAGLAGCVAVGLWIPFHFGEIEQSITSVWVLSFAGSGFDTYHKGVQRLGGCLVGGIVAALFMLIPANFPAFLFLVFCASLFSAIIQNGPTYARYFGIQITFAFLMVYANTKGIEPASLRLLSIVSGLLLTIFFSVLVAELARRFDRAAISRKQ